MILGDCGIGNVFLTIVRVFFNYERCKLEEILIFSPVHEDPKSF